MATAEEQAEIADLARRYGEPRRWTREYPVTTVRNARWVNKSTRRRGEVILVVPRPHGRVLVHTKSDYPDQVYRLPGGGIERGEKIEVALEREAHEEMGFELRPARFLGIVENVFHAGGTDLRYPSYIFSTPITAQPPEVLDSHEEISGFRDVPLAELGQIARRLESLPPEWQPWGRFRAAPHELVLETFRYPT